MSVERAQEEIDSKEYADWLAFYLLAPWGEERIENAIARGNVARFGGRISDWKYRPPKKQSFESLWHDVKTVFSCAAMKMKGSR